MNGGYSISPAKRAAARQNLQKAVEARRKEAVVKACANCGKPMRFCPSTAQQRVTCSKECRYQLKRGPNGAAAGRRADMEGSKNHNWRGGAIAKSEDWRKSAESFRWKRAVRYRDKYRCRRCGTRQSSEVRLDAHHVVPGSNSIELRFDITNGVSLCRDCHTWVHSKNNANREFLG